jgi:hypothetical protein
MSSRAVTSEPMTGRAHASASAAMTSSRIGFLEVIRQRISAFRSATPYT